MSLDAAKFKLDTFERLQDIKIKVANANMDLALKATQVIEKQVKIARDVEELRQLRSAHDQYIKMIHFLRKQIKDAKDDAEKLATAKVRALQLLWAEAISPGVVTASWNGFGVLVNNITGNVASRIFLIPLDASECKGENFVYPRDPDTKCQDAPQFGSAMQVFQWIRRKAWVPRSTSTLFAKLAEIFEMIEKDASASLALLEAEYEEKQAKLLEVSQGNWRAAGIVK